MWKHREKITFFLNFIFDQKKSTVFVILVIKTYFKLNFGYFWPFKKRLKIFLSFLSFKKLDLSYNFFLFFFKSKLSYLLSQNLQQLFFFFKKMNLIKYNGRKLSFKMFAPSMSSILRPRTLILDFLQFYLIKLISFKKQNVLVSFSAICAWNMSSYRHILVPKCEFKSCCPCSEPNLKSKNLNSWFSPILPNKLIFIIKKKVAVIFFPFMCSYGHISVPKRKI